MVGYFKVRRKNSKLQSKLIMWATKKNLKYKFKRKDINIRKKNKNKIQYIIFLLKIRKKQI